jgi:hypothetical protein
MAFIDNINALKDAVINNPDIQRTTAKFREAVDSFNELAEDELTNLENSLGGFDDLGGDVVNFSAIDQVSGVASDLASAASSIQKQFNTSSSPVDDFSEFDDFGDIDIGNAGSTNTPDDSNSASTLTVKQTTVSNVSPFTSISGMLGTANRLHNYASWTYRLSLFLLSKDDYHTISDSPESFVPKNCIVAGAGKNVTSLNSGTKHPEFLDDFYFEDMRIQTMVGMNAQSKSSNALDFNFTIVEPYGLTFLDRLLVATKGLDSKNYTDMPYLLQIEFYGHKDDGTTDFLPIPGTLKRFPIRLVAMAIDVGVNGATYKITATPYNSGAFDDKIATAGVNLQVNGDTVEKFFSAPGVAKVGQAIADQRTEVDGAPKKIAISNVQVSVDSLTAGLNGWFEYQKSEKARDHQDIILFEIDEKIAKSKIIRENVVPPNKTQMAKAGTQEGTQISKGSLIGGNPTRKDWVINAGTTVLKIIDQVIRSSDYIHKQIADPNDPKWAGKSGEDIAAELKKPLQWYKVIPSVRLGEFDEKVNRFSKIITYHIKEYTVADSKHPLGPKEKPSTWHKEYNYLYTGQNVDVLDFKIEFNALFYQMLSINRSNQQTSQVNASGKKEATQIDFKDPDNGKNSAQPKQTEIKASDGTNAESKTQTIDDIQKNLYQNAKGDMINITLDIVGDPDFIKQDDVYINPSQGTYDANTKTANNKIAGTGSLVMDRGELFAKVTFKTPVDIDLDTGLLREDTRYRQSSFSGIYRILSVMNMFGQGVFKQNIDMIRCYDLEEKAAGAISGERSKDAPQTAKQITPAITKQQAITPANLQSFVNLDEEDTDLSNAGPLSTVSQQAAQTAGGGFGILSNQAADLAAAFGGGPLDLGKAVAGAVDELSGAVGLRLPSAEIGALAAGSSDIIQSGLNLANRFTEGVGVTGAQLDLTQIANDVNEFVTLAESKLRRSTDGGSSNNDSMFT